MADVIHIGLLKAREALKWAVETYGKEHVNVHCNYVREDGPGCIVGEALIHIGVPRDTFWTINGMSIDMISQLLSLRDVFTMTPAAVEYFQLAQDVQDEGRPWGEAYDAAEGVVI